MTIPWQRRARTGSFTRARQRGFALLVLMAIIIVALAYVLATGLSAGQMRLERDRRTDEALALAKEALIGRAAADANHPGSLPCPDTDDDGSAELLSGTNCPSYIGRLPWRTLGLPDRRDGSGERLWYALSPSFRDSTNTINSDTLGTLIVYAPDGTTQLIQPGFNAVAIIFAPGPVVGAQARNSAAERNNPANYLDSASGRNNATGISASPPSFIAGSLTATFNDRLLMVTTRDLLPPVEQRVARELIKVLDRFNATFGFYPWADLNLAIGEYVANWGLNRGKLPLILRNPSAVFPEKTHTSTQDAYWRDFTTGLPSWFQANNWQDVIFYAVGGDYTAEEGDCGNRLLGNFDASYSCTGSNLRVDGVSENRVLFFMPGPPQPCGVSASPPFMSCTPNIGFNTNAEPRPSLSYVAYLADGENSHGNTAGGSLPGNDDYVTPASTAQDRNRIYYRNAAGTWCLGDRTLSGATRCIVQ